MSKSLLLNQTLLFTEMTEFLVDKKEYLKIKKIYEDLLSIKNLEKNKTKQILKLSIKYE